jgi:hypothetical protein
MTALNRTDLLIPPAVPNAAPEASPQIPTPLDIAAVPTGPAAAALLAAGVGCAVLGALTVLVEASPRLKADLTFSNPVGPLSGKTIVATAAWALTWIWLHLLLRRRRMPLVLATTVAVVLIVIGLLGTFPPVFQAFGR